MSRALAHRLARLEARYACAPTAGTVLLWLPSAGDTPDTARRYAGDAPTVIVAHGTEAEYLAALQQARQVVQARRNGRDIH